MGVLRSVIKVQILLTTLNYNYLSTDPDNVLNDTFHRPFGTQMITQTQMRKSCKPSAF